MSLLPFLAIAFGAGAVSLLTRSYARLSGAIGIAGLAAATAAAAFIGPDQPLGIAGGALAGSAFARLFLLLGGVTGLLLSLVAGTTAWSRGFPGATLVGLGGAGLALGVVDTGTAIAAATAGAAAGILLMLARPVSPRNLVAAARELRALVVAGALALAAAAAVAGPLAAFRLNPQLIGLAYLAFATAVAIRLGAIPFHLWAARVADAAPAIGLPLVMAWCPAAFATVALAWADGAVAPLGQPLGLERGAVLAIGGVSVILGAAAAFVHDDLEHIVGYSIVADAGVIILGLAALDPAAWEPSRTWLLAFVAGKSAFAGWAAAVGSTFGTRRLSELQGWARRAPVLGIALLAIIVAAVGLPGMAVFGARVSLIDLAVDGPLVTVLVVAALASLAYYGRLLVAGLLGAGAGAPAAGRPEPAPSRRDPLAATFLGDFLAALDARRTPVAAGAVLALAAIALAVAGGGLGVREAAASLPPAVGVPGESFSPP